MDLERIFRGSPWSITWLNLYLSAQCCLCRLFTTTAASCSLCSAAHLCVWLPVCWSLLIDYQGLVPLPTQSLKKISSPGMCTGNLVVRHMLCCLLLLLTKAVNPVLPTLCVFFYFCAVSCFFFLWPEFWFGADCVLALFAERCLDLWLMSLGAMVIQIINEGLFNSSS